MMISRTLHKGFAFAEIMMALAMIGFLLTTLLTLQSNVFNRVVKSTSRIERFYPLKNTFITIMKKPLQKGTTKEEIQVPELGLKVAYEVAKIKDASPLYRFTGLYQKKCVGAWALADRPKEQEMIGYGFMIPEKKA